jgi:excisionase family DNA binding protein
MSKSFTPPASVSGCLDRRESASYLSISTRLLDDLAAQGKLPRVKIGRKTLFRVADLDAFVDSKVQRLSCCKAGE